MDTVKWFFISDTKLPIPAICRAKSEAEVLAIGKPGEIKILCSGTIDLDRRAITVDSPMGHWNFREGHTIEVRGLEESVNWLIYKIHPNGMTLISSETSIPKFHKLQNLLWSGLIADCIHNTGRMEIR